MREEENELAQSLGWRRLLLVGFLIVVTRIVAERIFDFEIKG